MKTSPLRVLYVGELPVRSSPLLTLSRALERHCGVEPHFSMGRELKGTRDWIRLVAEFNAVIYVGYDGPVGYVVRQLAIARFLGVKIIRWWVGTDVLTVLKDGNAARNAHFVPFCRFKVAVAPHLADELSSVGISSEVIPSIAEGDFVVLAKKRITSIVRFWFICHPGDNLFTVGRSFASLRSRIRTFSLLLLPTTRTHLASFRMSLV